MVNGNKDNVTDFQMHSTNIVDDFEASSATSCKSDGYKPKKGFKQKFHKLLRRFFSNNL